MAPNNEAKTPGQLPLKHAGGQWNIGVDFVSLSKLAGTLYGYVPTGGKAVSAIDKAIAEVCHDAGWKGDTAKAFLEAWDNDTQFAKKLMAFEDAAGKVIDDLALSLSWIQLDLNKQVDEINRTVGVMNFGNDPAAAQAALRQKLDEAARRCNEKSEEAQRKAAGKLMDLYTGKAGGWSAIKALDELEHNKLVPDELRKSLAKAEEGLKKTLPDTNDKSILEQVMDSNTVKAAGAFAGIGAGIGGMLGGPPGSLVGGAIGAVGGGIWGGLDDIF